MPRLFVAIALPHALKTALGRLRQDFPDLKWAGNQHLTLRFIGEAPEAALARIRAALCEVRFFPFPLKVLGLGLFQRRDSGVFLAGIGNSPELASLKSAVDQALCRAGLDVPRDAYAPHITLSRIREKPPSSLKKAVRMRNNELFGEFEVAEFCLFQSFLRASGARHEQLAAYSGQ